MRRKSAEMQRECKFGWSSLVAFERAVPVKLQKCKDERCNKSMCWNKMNVRI